MSQGQILALVAVPAPGSLVAGWEGCTPVASDTCLLTPTGDAQVTVTFGLAPLPVQIQVVGPGAGQVTNDHDASSCSGSCTLAVPPGTALTLNATGAPGPFQGWGGDCSGEGPDCHLVADAARVVRAVFGHLAAVSALSWAEDGNSFTWMNGIALGPDGDLYVSGYFDAAIHFGDLAAVSHGQNDAFVARLDGATGQARWLRTFGGPREEYGAFLRVVEGRVLLGVEMGGASVDFGTGPVDGNGYAIVELDDAGVTRRVRTLGALPAVGRVAPFDMVMTPDGRLFVSGWFKGTVDFGVRTATNRRGFEWTDAFLLAYDADGNPAWLRTAAAGNGHADYYRLALSADGDVIAGGNVQGAIDLGAGPLAVPPGHALFQRDAFVARYRASDGAHLWSRLIAGTGDVGVDRLLVDEAGRLFVPLAGGRRQSQSRPPVC